jgi:hypothetical protein
MDSFSRHRSSFLIGLLLGLLSGDVGAVPLPPFPADAPVLNVTDLGADPTGKTDSADAIEKAIRQVEEGHFRIWWVYLPAGEYRITRPIVGGRFVTLIGDGADKTTLKLADSSDGFGDPNALTAALQLGRTANESFGAFIQGLTIDTGKGNPGAVGLDYQGHNVGAIRDLRIRSGDGTGVAGLKLKRSERKTELTPGPHLVKNVEIIGFDRGVWLGENRSGICHVTFENIRLRDQKLAGFHFDTRLHAAIHRLHSTNACPAILFERSYGAAVSITASRFESPSDQGSAIEMKNGENRIYLGDVRRAGYAALVSRPGEAPVSATEVPEWISHKAVTIPGENATGEFLEAVDTPVLPTFPLDQWQAAQPRKLDAALASGKPVVYFPRKAEDPGSLAIFPGPTETVGIPRHVQHFAFFGQAITAQGWKGGDAAVFRIEGTKENPPLFVSRNDYHNQHLFKGPLFEHAGSRTVVFLSSKGSYCALPGAGDVFFEDHVGGYFQFQEGQRVFGRQLNPEDARHDVRPLIDNRGADFWVLGLKSEGAKTIVRQSGGSTRVHGGLFLPLITGSTRDLPLFDITGGDFEATGYTAWYTWPIHVRAGQKPNLQELSAKGKRSEGFLQVSPPISEK